MHRVATRLAACLLFAVLTTALDVAADIVRHVQITGNTRTRTDVIRREILFEPGDSLTADLIEETERNLRALLFLDDISVVISREGIHTDVLIRVKDQYARGVTPLLSGRSGELSYGVVGLDYNFFGRGQTAELTVEHDAVTGNRFRAFYREPRVGGTRIKLDLDGEVAAEGHRVVARVSRPFYRLSEPWSVGVSGFRQESVTRLYAGQTLVEKYVTREDGGSFSLRRSTGEGVKVRPGIFLSLSDRTSVPEAGYIYAPPDRRRVLLSVGITIWRPHYETTQFFRRLGRTEDLQMGSWVSVRAGASLEALGSDRDYRFVTLDANPRYKIDKETYLLARFTYRSQFSGGRVWNVFGSAEFTALRKVHRVHALAVRIRFDGLGRTEDTAQYLLGSVRGLRGYSLRRFDGSRRLFGNLEARPTLVRKDTFTLAGVVFVDGGSAWTPGTGDRELAVSAGVGARLGMSRVYNSPVLRADLGYGFRDRTWVLYMGLGQYF